MSKQRRFTTEKQITDRIDDLRLDAANLLRDSVEHDRLAAEAIRQIQVIDLEISYGLKGAKLKKARREINTLKHQIQEHRKEAQRMSKRRNTIEQATLPRLKNALAEFNTRLLPITDDPAVVLR